MTMRGDEVRALIAEQAAEWFVANQAGRSTPAERAAFLAWLRTSPTHLSEYLGVARVARGLGGVIGTAQEPMEAYLSALPAQAAEPTAISPHFEHHATPEWPARRRWRRPALALAAGLLVLVPALWWRTRTPEPAGPTETYRTAHGEGAVARLMDGSVMRLDVDTDVTVRYESRERIIELKQGRAFFRVAHGAERRRFRVQTGSAGAIAVGTQFDVRRQGDGAVFTVAEGEIAVFAASTVPLRDEPGLPSRLRHVTAGYQLTVAAGSMSEPVPVDLDHALAWLRQPTVFDHRPLADVVAEFNRVGPVPIEIHDSELRSLPVSGVFDVGDTESFVAFLRTLSGVTVTSTRERIVVSRTAPAPAVAPR